MFAADEFSLSCEEWAAFLTCAAMVAWLEAQGSHWWQPSRYRSYSQPALLQNVNLKPGFKKNKTEYSNAMGICEYGNIQTWNPESKCWRWFDQRHLICISFCVCFSSLWAPPLSDRDPLLSFIGASDPIGFFAERRQVESEVCHNNFPSICARWRSFHVDELN